MEAFFFSRLKKAELVFFYIYSKVFLKHGLVDKLQRG